jgi:hypothetical protein
MRCKPNRTRPAAPRLDLDGDALVHARIDVLVAIEHVQLGRGNTHDQDPVDTVRGLSHKEWIRVAFGHDALEPLEARPQAVTLEAMPEYFVQATGVDQAAVYE